MNMNCPKAVQDVAEAISKERLIQIRKLDTQAGFVAHYKTDQGLRAYGQSLIKQSDGSFGILILPDGRIPEEVEARFILQPDFKDLEEITVTVQLTYSCPIDATLTAQRAMIHDDLARLLDYDSTTEVECSQFIINHVASEAETYGNIEGRNLAERQTRRIQAALAAIYDEQHDDPQALLQNALCDLRHFADQNGLSHALVDRSAFAIYRAEKDHADTGEATKLRNPQ